MGAEEKPEGIFVYESLSTRVAYVGWRQSFARTVCLRFGIVGRSAKFKQKRLSLLFTEHHGLAKKPVFECQSGGAQRGIKLPFVSGVDINDNPTGGST
jgi:hypothetical protein